MSSLPQRRRASPGILVENANPPLTPRSVQVSHQDRQDQPDQPERVSLSTEQSITERQKRTQSRSSDDTDLTADDLGSTIEGVQLLDSAAGPSSL
jgi:cell division protein FtsN